MRRSAQNIEQGQHVRLVMGDLPAVAARVEELTETRAILVLDENPPLPLEAIGEVEGAIEAPGVRGLARVVGTVRQYRGAPNVCRLDIDQGPEVVQRRQFVRIDTSTAVRLTRADGSRVKTETVNLSGAGLLLAGPDDLELHELVKVDIDVGPGAAPIHVRGRVIRETGQQNKGVRIELIEEGARDRLIHFLFERERVEARARVR